VPGVTGSGLGNIGGLVEHDKMQCHCLCYGWVTKASMVQRFKTEGRGEKATQLEVVDFCNKDVEPHRTRVYLWAHPTETSDGCAMGRLRNSSQKGTHAHVHLRCEMRFI
jgi:hypothetical protein